MRCHGTTKCLHMTPVRVLTRVLGGKNHKYIWPDFWLKICDSEWLLPIMFTHHNLPSRCHVQASPPALSEAIGRPLACGPCGAPPSCSCRLSTYVVISSRAWAYIHVPKSILRGPFLNLTWCWKRVIVLSHINKDHAEKQRQKYVEKPQQKYADIQSSCFNFRICRYPSFTIIYTRMYT